MEQKNLRDMKTADPGTSLALCPLELVAREIQGYSPGGKLVSPILPVIRPLNMFHTPGWRASYHGSKTLSVTENSALAS